MNLETFFDKFELFADAPGAVAKMRELVLQLALDGRLIGSDSTKWKRIKLGSLGGWGSGGTPLRSEPRYYGGKIPWLVIGDLNDGIVTSASTFITKEGLANSSARVLPKGVLLIAMYGSIGKLGITGIECATNQAIAFCKPDAEQVLLRYLFHTVKAIQPALLERGQGLAQKNISQTILKAWEIGLPPLTEQKRIVAKVDELMALCDRLEAQQQERATRHAALARASLARFAAAPTPADLEFLFHNAYAIPPADLRKSILTLAVQGKLVPQDLDDTPAAQAIRTARANAGLPQTNLSRNPDELPFVVPETWEWVKVADVAQSRLGKMLDKQKNRGEAHPYLRNTNVHWLNFQLDSIKKMLFDPSELDEYRVEPGDVLICEGGHGIARAAVWEGQIPGIMFQKALHRVTPLACLNGYFLAFCLRVYEYAGILQRYYTGAGIPHFTGKSLAKITFPLPPLAEQRRIVAKVDELMALVDKLEAELARARAVATNLLAAAVAEMMGRAG